MGREFLDPISLRRLVYHIKDELSKYAKRTEIPSKLSELDNDSGYITEVPDFTETDPTVPAWAKEPTKPSYTASEVGALPNTTVIPSKVSQLENDLGYLTEHQDISHKADASYVNSKISDEANNRLYTDSVLEERINKIKYYGDADIEISPEEWFVFHDKEHTILVGFSEGHENETDIVIPYSVTTIAPEAFMGCTYLTSVTIPDSVTSIEESSFNECASLKSINIPNSVTGIGIAVFNECASLKSINIPNSVISINGEIFAGCTNLTIYCEQGSYADTYAKANNIPVKYTDIYIDKTVTANSENAVSSGAVFEAVNEAVSIAKSDSLQAISTSESANTTAQQAIANADSAIEIAQSVRADADSGKFDGTKGEKGDKGDKGEQGIQGEKGDDGKDGADYIITEADKEEIKADVVETLTRSSTALPEMLDVNTIYDLGEQDALTLNLPAGKLGDFIEVDFLSTQTPTTLTITASSGMSDYKLIPDANTIYSLYFNWIRLDAENYGWGFGYAEYTRTVKV